MKDNTRNLKIQYRFEKQVHSLPAITVPTRELEKSDVLELLEDCMTAPVVVQLLNNQAHISFSSKAGERIIKGIGNMDPETAASEVIRVKERGIDFREEIIRHAQGLAEKRAKSGKVDKIQELIRTKWETSTKKAEFLERLGLPATLVEYSAEDVEAAYIAQRDSAEDWL